MRRATFIAWLPLAILPAAVVVLVPAAMPRWIFMWLLAGTIFAGCRWLTWRTSRVSDASAARHFAYLALWPGLDAQAFLDGPRPPRPALSEWAFALAKLGLGLVLIFGIFPRLSADHELAAGWVGMIGILFVLHFGLFHVLSLAWRTAGVLARPLMDWPVLATSVSDFWGRRWNTAFRDLTHRFLFRPLTPRLGAKGALLVGFAVSGLVHDLVISVPAGGGSGGPTAYFLIQAVALFLERSALGQRIGLARGLFGWAFTMLVLLVPLPLLFHSVFVREVIVPFLDWTTSLGRTT